MSRVQRHGMIDDDQRGRPPPPSVSFHSRVQMPPHSPALHGDLIPRDYLGPRADGQTLRSTGVAPSARKPMPSPLHTSFNIRSPTRDDLTLSTQSPLSPRSNAITNPFQSHPFRNRAVQPDLSASPTTVNPDPTTVVEPEPNQEGPLGARPQHAVGMADTTKLFNPARKDSDAADSSRSATSSPSSPVNSQQSLAREQRSGHRHVIPRTSSIDSAISSLSTASYPHKSSFDASALSQADINNLISTAGSAEAVIIHLLKEKHHAASQNAQLWRLVDKQRTMVLGLNKDLERALKEKERYRKKLKELQSAAYTSSGLHDEPSNSVDDDALIQSENQSQVGSSDRQTPRSQSLENKSRNEAEDSLTVLPESFPIPLSSEEPALYASLESLDKTVTRPGDRAKHIHESDTPLSRLATSSVMQQSFATTVGSIIHEASPVEDLNAKVPHPSRKPPPAPLNLKQKDNAIAPLSIQSDSESEYEDILEVDELIDQERGRRKTREEDDRDREVALAKKSSSRSTNKNPQQLDTLGALGGAHDIPPTHRVHVLTPQHLPAGSSLMEQTESLAAVLNSQGGRRPTRLDDRPLIASPKSPGLPLSPRPGDRPLNSPLPRNPREGAVAFTPSGMSSPRLTNKQVSSLSEISSSTSMKMRGPVPTPISLHAANQQLPSIDPAVKIDSPRTPQTIANRIYQGLVSEDYPGLLLSPNALPLIQVKVFSSRLRPSRNSYLALKPSEEEPVFTLSIFSRSEHRELWRVEKIIAALPQLDQQIRQSSDFPVKLPDRGIFSGHSPAKVDARRAALNSYFERLLETPMDEQAALIICQFLTSDAIEPRDDETVLIKANNQMRPEILRGPDGKPRKEGYLTKRGKNFGGWKARYFILHGPEFKYFESPNGPHLGTIRIHNAQIGKQSQNMNIRSNSPSHAEDDSENQYRHAFLILEPKKKDSSALVRHVLCAESDEERDAWVEVLLEYVENHSDHEGHAKIHMSHGSGRQPSSGKSRLFLNGSKKTGKGGGDLPESDSVDTVQGFSYDDAIPAEPPVLGVSPETQGSRSLQLPTGSSLEVDTSHLSNAENPPLSPYSFKVISGPTNGAVIQDAGAWGNKAATSTKEKKRSIWGFRTRSSADLASQLQAHQETLAAQGHDHSLMDRREPVRPVFGIPLAEAVQYCAPQGVKVELPAVVYRCIEYLQAKDVASEEGIFRLSGSNVVVKALKERFNTEGDVDFLAGDQYYDVHAVASLFKQYLRELPTTVLTRELHLDFLRVLELDDRNKKIMAFNSLVYRLPKPNLALLRALAQFLLGIVNNSDVNKMTVRNVGIVFAPTLNIPAPVFSMFLTDFSSIFSEPAEPIISTSDLATELPSAQNRDNYSSSPPERLTAYNSSGMSPVQENNEQIAPEIENNEVYEAPSQLSMNRALTPHTDDLRSAKAKRRESSLLFMEASHQESSSPTFFNKHALIDEEPMSE
ncbi:hypothetical protein ASPZODRAFT_141027 [Penicilliopsis zonata CBS 506.65]|uniref:RhoGAP-domain-containing protein n=1 Tax=Penicilliopsis zonata CBS 506.65 TaxID=1073090 RepID=A0A1L9SJL7_9EURO|nr:hypothetical protein ASPZODRAFT_141027 [Penicilliopsis zonata CBS 506.65]OJJ47429.1 hypothetical protein ASPZODRAFT_141027 [Penicilliopsis zonata CBS 506.65]